ncbi:chorismate mutase [Kitasatospora sp. NPDC101157]|uniref:chorismate mutase n=1 Tax=Kitasatospora sp. NPDC101157 TaxID=3364098 RepID=UPI003817D11D
MTVEIDVEAQIAADRLKIDELDTRIIELLAQRALISRGIQERRIGAGGPRTVFGREMDILARYRDELGASGTQIAMSVFELCRGAGPVGPAGPRATA